MKTRNYAEQTQKVAEMSLSAVMRNCNLAVCWKLRESDSTRKSKNLFGADNQQGRIKGEKTMKCILIYSENVSVTEDERFVLRTRIFQEDSEEKILEKVRQFKTRNRRSGQLYVIDHEVTLPVII